MIQTVKNVFEMDEVKFTLFLSNNGLGHFELHCSFKYKFIRHVNDKTCWQGHKPL